MKHTLARLILDEQNSCASSCKVHLFQEMPPALAEPAERRQAAALKPSNVMFQAPPIPKQAPGVSAQSWQQGWGGMAMQPPPNVQLNNAMGLQSACSQEGPHGGLPTKAEAWNCLNVFVRFFLFTVCVIPEKATRRQS